MVDISNNFLACVKCGCRTGLQMEVVRRWGNIIGYNIICYQCVKKTTKKNNA
jgi:hypothetical protein